MTKLYECLICETSQLSEEKLREHCLKNHGRTLEALLSAKCDLCNEPMHQIGPFADLKKEGEPASKWNGVTKYQCTNQACEKYEQIIEIPVGSTQ